MPIAICGSSRLYPGKISPFPALRNEGGTESLRTLAGCAAGQFESPKHQPVSLRALDGRVRRAQENNVIPKIYISEPSIC